MSESNKEQPLATVSNHLSLDSLTIHDDSNAEDRFISHNKDENDRLQALFSYYQDIIARNDPTLDIKDYQEKCQGQQSSQQKDASEEELIDLDEATKIIPRREFPLVPSDATVAQAFLVSGLDFTTGDSLANFDSIADLIDSLQSDLPSPSLTLMTHNVDTNAFKKSIKTKKASNSADEEDSPEESVPHSACARCQHNPAIDRPGLTLLTCEKCESVEYCSFNCQLGDWTAHQVMYCVNPATIPPEHLAKPHIAAFLKTPLPNPFARLSKGIWLHDRHKQDVYTLLIDSFRLRESDDYWYAGLTKSESIYNGKESSCSLFRMFLDWAEIKELMPPWWSHKKRVECIDLGLDRSFDNFHDLGAMTRDVEILVVYESAMMLMQLRMFAESVLGTGSAKTNGKLMLQKMVVAEEAARTSAKK
ncbi:hypothetical protein TASIC1_0009020900 [Trichoderma asperellum]|uniref:MYND-type domain-containing protein n=1 Tax=Trichoderma asperellum TaxID=101201 RepID=A0A6V8R0R7_TRIAP|nr:hypothetical protein TASIC1_0009020900 [Trichoderma asperellum]